MTTARDDWLRPLHPHLAPQLLRCKDGGVQEGSELTDAILGDARQQRATDVHLDPQSRGLLIRFRVDGALHDVAMLDGATGERLTRHFKVLAGLDTSVSFKPMDSRASHQLDDHVMDMRLAFAPSVRGLKLAIRLLDTRRARHRIKTIGLNKSHYKRIKEWMAHGTGAFLVTGPTGSGKTTTLYAVLHELDLRPCSVVTVEDPVEYLVDGITQIQADEARGLGMTEALRSMLRLDPDFLLLGEIRDAETARIALLAASAGRALLSTLHTRDAVGAVTALRNYGLSDYDISSTLEVVVAQRLVRRLCPGCARPAALASEQRRWFDRVGLVAPPQVRVPRGCSQCQDLGYHGRVGVFEIWRLDERDYDAILDHRDEHAIRARLLAGSFRNMLADACKKLQLGLTSFEEIETFGAPVLARAVRDPDEE